MVFGGFSSTLRRLTLVALAFGVVSVGSATTAWAQAQAAPAAPAAPPDDFKFSSDSGGMIWIIKTDKVAGFDEAWAAIRAKLAASDKPELKELGASLKIYKSATPPTPEGQTYFFIADPASKAQTYNPSFLLFQSGLFTRPEADVIFPKINDAIAGLNVIPLTKVQ